MKNYDSIATQNSSIVSTMCSAVFTIIIFSLSFAYALGQSPPPFLLEFENPKTKIDTFKVDYTQFVFFEHTKEKQEMCGTIFFKNGSICMIQRMPQEQQIYVDGKNITIYTPANKQAVVDDWKNVIDVGFNPATIVDFRNSWKKIKKTNVINFEFETKNHVIIRITPIKNKKWDMKVYISKTTMNVDRAVMCSEDVTIEIIFKNYIANPLLNKNMFELKVSDDVEIIKLN
ncbi:MAG: outer membrane lipoprotein carrier protein LolA [Endomicrobium sp.]|nr:outer membrane lipoprotein carrier protein LolA [Endomicrobium sp.]